MFPQGEYHCDIMKDLFGDGIFAVDGEKWRHQRKLASYKFSTKVLRDFSTSVFQDNAAKLVLKVSMVAAAKQMMDLQVCSRLEAVEFYGPLSPILKQLLRTSKLNDFDYKFSLQVFRYHLILWSR